jgi:hypothetical protein
MAVVLLGIAILAKPAPLGNERPKIMSNAFGNTRQPCATRESTELFISVTLAGMMMPATSLSFEKALHPISDILTSGGF